MAIGRYFSPLYNRKLPTSGMHSVLFIAINCLWRDKIQTAACASIWDQRKDDYKEGEEQSEEGDESLLPEEFLDNEAPLIAGVESGIE